ncbi:fluoride efflux transporter CrcB [Oceanicella actignis]|uniref:fluoride efflux transporter CrcB n=1 Tax=Oceanicella actignis TaxID=1189325 RepID=UPI0011E80813|nr:fluoride efflux transporter CrcB [Oceanicella actignis]TYO88284.1 camphor resistance protein CrcB [Oceanicella actignis]
MTYASVAAGGALGALLRFLVVRWSGRAFGMDFPWGTAIVNVAGSVLMGVLAVVLMERAPGAWQRFAPFAMTGVLGGFTTFSAFSLDAAFLIERGRFGAAAAYMAGSVGLALLGLVLGMAGARALLGAAS